MTCRDCDGQSGTWRLATSSPGHQPDPVEDYLETLALAYAAAHRAYDRVLVGHAAFLTPP